MASRNMNYEERLLYVTRNLMEYNEYGRDPAKASKVIKKYFKEKSLDECRSDLDLFMNAYKAAIVFVNENKDEFWKRAKAEANDLIAKEKTFFSSHIEISEPMLRSLLLWIFNWYHER